MRPLYIVSLEELNTRSVRSFALKQLRHINESTGIRQAGLLADAAWKSLNESSGDIVSVTSRVMIPLIPCG